MANATLRTLTTGTAILNSDLFLTRQGADTQDKSVTGTQIKTFIAGAAGASQVLYNNGGVLAGQSYATLKTNLNLAGTNSGDVTLTAVGAVPNANGASLSGQALTLQPADTTHPGVLLAADWNTFNNKQPAGNYITALTGDVTATGPGSVASTVAKIQGTAVSGTTGTTNVVFSNSPTLVTPNIGAATGTSLSVTGTLQADSTLIQLGTTDPFVRTQILNNAPSNILRLGTWQSDGDATSVLSEGIVSYGDSLTGNPIGPGDGGYARVKPNRFGLFTVDSTLPAYTGGAYYFRIDDTAMFYKNNAGTTTFNVTRATGDTTIGGTLGVTGNITAANLGTISSQNANNVNITGGTITGMPTPTGGTDVANKNYVDAATAGLAQKQSVRVVSQSNQVGTYLNGASGVGATFTYTATGTDVIDGYTLQLNDRIALVGQTAGLQNGIYQVTTAGAIGVSGVLTRVTDYDQASEIVAGTYFLVEDGTDPSTGGGKGTLWINTNYTAITVGTDAITFTELAVAPQTITMTSDVTGTGSGTIALTVAKIQGTTVSGTTGSTNVVFSNSPTLVTPNLGTPSAAVLTNATGLPLTTGVTGTLPTANGGTNHGNYTAGSVIFAGAGGTSLTEDTGFPLSWDNTNKRFNIGAPGTGKLNITNAGGSDLGLNVYSTSSNNAVSIQNQSAYTLMLTNAANSALAGSSIGGAFSRGTLAARTQSLAGDQLFSLTAQGYTGSAFQAGFVNAISFVATENSTATNGGGELVFSTTPNGTLTPVPALTLNQDQTASFASSISIAGGTALATSNQTGTGSIVLANSPVLTTPNIGSATGSISGNAGTATALQTARTINGTSFDGTANITIDVDGGTA